MHLVHYLFEAGPVEVGGFGEAPLSFGELAQWSALSCTPLTPWEARTLRVLSREYLQERQQAKDPVRPAPYADVSEENRERVAQRLRGMFRQMKATAEAKQDKRKRKSK